MSTKNTIKYNDDYHLYVECFEADYVYLQIDKPEYFEARPDFVRIKIPQQIFEQFGSKEVVKRLQRHSQEAKKWKGDK